MQSAGRFVGYIARTFVCLVLLLSLSFAVGSETVYAGPGDPVPAAPAPGGDPTNPPAEEEEELSCAIAKMGWILCPVIETAGQIGDQAFQFMAKSFLETEPELVAAGDRSGTYKAWELARNLANIMFIIVFLIIILSQVTGRGLDNYGIKKTLPRLIIAAIAVNISYYICQLMVDLSNILGYEIQNFLVEMSVLVSDRVAMPPTSDIGLHTGKGTLAVIAAAILATVAIVWLLLPVLIMGVGTIVITCIVIVVILLMRKAFIVLLVVASPIAFVLYLLPNTESYFRKWLSMFWKLLMVFPVVGLLFGGGQLASAIVLVAGTSTQSSQGNQGGEYHNVYSDGGDKCVTLPRNVTNGQGERQTQGQGAQDTSKDANIGACGANSTPLMLGLVAAGIAVAPLLAVWSVLRGALSAAGAIGGKVSGAVESYTGKGVGAAGGKFKKSALGRGMEARKAIKENYKNQKFAKKMGGSGARGAYTRMAARGFQGNVGRVVGGSWGAQNAQLKANFANVGEELHDKELKEREAQIRQSTEGNMSEIADQFTKFAMAGDELGAQAAESLLHSMGASGTDMWLGAMRQMERGINGKKIGADMMKELQKHTRLKHPTIKGTSVGADEWATSSAPGASLTDVENSIASYKNLSGDHVLGQSKESLDAMQRAMNAARSDPNADPAHIQALQHAAQEAIRSQGFSKAKAGNQARMYDLAGIARPASLNGV